MDTPGECGQAAESHALSERAVRALAVAQLRRAQYELARTESLKTKERSQKLRRGEDLRWATHLREAINAVAREELAAGHSPVQMVCLLHEIVDEAALDQRVRQEVEPDVVLWGIEAYFAA